MRRFHLFIIIILTVTFAACDGGSLSPGADIQPTDLPVIDSTPTPFIPLMETEVAPAPTAVNRPLEVISAANAQSLQVGAQVVEGQAQAFSWLPGGEEVALVVDQGIMIYSVDSTTVVHYLTAPQPSSLSKSEQAQWLAWVTQENTIQILDVEEHRQVAEIQSSSGAVTSLSLAPQGGLMALATFDQHLQVWGAQGESFKLIMDWKLPYWLTNLVFSPDGNLIAGANLPEFKVHLFDLATGVEVRTLHWSEHASPALYAVEFSPDWKYLAWTARGSVLIMNVASGETTATLEHEDFVNAVAWSTDGSLLATGAAGTINGQLSPAVYLWEAASGSLAAEMQQHGSVLSMSFSPDGRELAVLTSGGALQIYRIAP
jgi:WD40 repeat protein